MKAGETTEAAIYLIRKGTVEIKTATNGDGTSSSSRIVEAGGYFGDEMLKLDLPENNNTNNSDGQSGDEERHDHHLIDGDTPFLLRKETTTQAQYTVTVVGEENDDEGGVVVGVLTLKVFREYTDTTRIGHGKKQQRYSTIGDSNAIALSSLKKHKMLGAGTFGQVWLVSYKEKDVKKSPSSSRSRKTPFALKIQSKHELVKNNQAHGTVQERNIMSQLQHPFIIRLFHTYQDSNLIYMLLRLIQGGELYRLIRKGGPMKESQAKFYAAGIFEGLSYMHRRHILYRDLKPENILIDNTGYPVIVDLGFAKFIGGATTGGGKTYTLCGTPLYIAPEVITNRGHDHGADHWSFAVLLYEMLTGRTPFYRKGMDQIMCKFCVLNLTATWEMSLPIVYELQSLVIV